MKLHHHPSWPQQACFGHHDVFDVLIDYDRGGVWRRARREAMDLCGGQPGNPDGGCPLRDACFADADANEETWHVTVREGLVRREKDAAA